MNDPQAEKLRRKMMEAATRLELAKKFYEAAQKKVAETRFDYFSHIEQGNLVHERHEQAKKAAEKAAKDLEIKAKRKELEETLGGRYELVPVPR